ncbi:TOMM precursor leader peptide-binding protein [Spongiactinospora sp. TRM90649]|uniref:TOMM precursor leader peptide-binding protein n=1 Tax=Spongiactinospora sp. TRM90649 TaxID=3031114 RepID=UPI0023F9BDF3|nr:TOMM precursor leader peptide-binding protein [Spongiactinospora sp. TRM90649]MDF5756349.1 TOMM precursor leader peptide-binding protein [Spongiactinospora sp. TRM90649]
MTERPSTTGRANGSGPAAGHPSIAVLGEGKLADAVSDWLAGHAEVVRPGDGHHEGDLTTVVIASDRTPPVSRWLPVRVELGTVVIGPIVVRGRPGCPTCLRLRSAKAREDAQDRRRAEESDPGRYTNQSGRLTALGAGVVAELVSRELSDDVPARVHRMRLDTLDVTSHHLLPEPSCPDCGNLPDDDAAAAKVTLVPRPKPDAHIYRVRDLREEADDLRATYVDAEMGLIRGLRRTVYSTYPTVAAPMGLSTRTDSTEMGFGRELDFRTAQVTAIAEALERYAGVVPGGKRTVVRGTYRELASTALDPKSLGLYPEDRYALPGFPFVRYDDDLEIPWVWGYSFARGEPILVPECCAYYRVPARPFVYEISNGCAIGGCLEEAILHGILELAERDAFLLTWYARAGVRELDLTSARDRRIPLMAERLRRTTGASVHAFDTTTENGVPSVWVMAVRPGEDESAPKALCAAGAGFVPERAIANGLLELAPLVEWRTETYAEELPRIRRMLSDPDEVRSMHDHSLLNGHPAAFARMGFLFDPERTPVAIEDSYAGSFQPAHDDLTADLRATVQRFLDLGQDVIVVDQTTPEQRLGGFACVKVTIPGLLPMTFGHRTRRVDGLPRVSQVPHLLGYAPAPLRPEDLNPHPHPFP